MVRVYDPRISTEPRIIVCHEKHDTCYWDATTLEIWAWSSLAILTQRWKDGYWYREPKNDGLGTSEWAEVERKERAKALTMTREQIDALPLAAKQQVMSLRQRARRETEEDLRYAEWYAKAKDIVENQDAGMQTVGRNRYAHDEPKAWVLLEERSDYEYERVELVILDTGKEREPFPDELREMFRTCVELGTGLAPKTIEWLKAQWRE